MVERLRERLAHLPDGAVVIMAKMHSDAQPETIDSLIVPPRAGWYRGEWCDPEQARRDAQPIVQFVDTPKAKGKRAKRRERGRNKPLARTLHEA